MCIVPKFIVDWIMIMLLLVLKLLVSSHPLNFKGVLAFMFCYFIKDKLNTTLLCFLYAQEQTVAFNALLFMLFCLSYFSCYNIVAKFYCLELYLSCLCLRVLWSQLTMLLHYDQDCVGLMAPQKLFLLSLTYSRMSRS